MYFNNWDSYGFIEIPTYFIVATSHTLLLLMLHRNTKEFAESNNYNVAAYRIPTDVFSPTGILRNTNLFYSCNVAHAAAAYVFSKP